MSRHTSAKTIWLVLFTVLVSQPARAEPDRYAAPCKLGDTNIEWFLAQPPLTQNAIVDEYRKNFQASMGVIELSMKNTFKKPQYLTKNRLKKAKSTIEKIRDKTYRCFSELGDISGHRVIIGDWSSLPNVEEKIRLIFDVRKYDYKIGLQKKLTYRGVHFDVLVDGRMAEIQIHTRRGTIVADASHSLVYKGPFSSNADVKAFLEKLSWAVFLRDIGESSGLPAPGNSLPLEAKACLDEVVKEIETVTVSGDFSYKALPTQCG